MSVRPVLRWAVLAAFMCLTEVGMLLAMGAPLLTALAIVSGIGAWFGVLVAMLVWLDL